MTPQLALILCYGVILWLWRKDMTWRKTGSKALLIPGTWIAIQGSRPVSYWFGGGGGSDANPIDTIVFALLIGLAILVLANRGFDWGDLLNKNRTLVLMYSYLLLSVVWSEAPLVSFKRLFKDFGGLMVGMVFLTGVNPAHSIRTVFVRVSYILFPLSIIFIKFFPHIGRSFTRIGEPMYGGVTTQKNSLGETLFVFSLFLIWDLVEIFKGEKRAGRNFQIMVRVGLLLLGLWLLRICDSQTSLLCLILGTGIFWGSGRLLKMRQGKKVLITILVSIACLLAADKTLGISEKIILALGRDPSLTGRTDIWRIVLEQKTDSLLGTGFYSFWDSSKGKAVIDAFMQVNEAHNGYLEMYLDGGLVGDALLILLILSAGRKAIDNLFAGAALGRVGLIFWLLPILYNCSETSFFRLDVLWFTFLMLTVACPQPHQAPQTVPNGQYA